MGIKSVPEVLVLPLPSQGGRAGTMSPAAPQLPEVRSRIPFPLGVLGQHGNVQQERWPGLWLCRREEGAAACLGADGCRPARSMLKACTAWCSLKISKSRPCLSLGPWFLQSKLFSVKTSDVSPFVVLACGELPNQRPAQRGPRPPLFYPAFGAHASPSRKGA